MNLVEYEKVKNLTYLEYCDYLQQKYGIGLSDYMTRSWNKNSKVSRTKDGLFAHHKYEDHAIMLSVKEYACQNPFEWQLAKNIVYCDFLEHLLLHILICQYPSKDKNENEDVGVGGVINYIVPQLNDLYSGWYPKQQWLKTCFDRVKNDLSVYYKLLERFLSIYRDDPSISYSSLLTSYGDKHGIWNKESNEDLFFDIMELAMKFYSGKK